MFGFELQDVFNLLPNLNVADLIKAFAGIYILFFFFFLILNKKK